MTDETTIWRYRLGQYVRTDRGDEGEIIARSEQTVPGREGEVRHSYRINTTAGPQWAPQRSVQRYDAPRNR